MEVKKSRYQAPGLTKRASQLEESNRTDARDVKTYSHLPQPARGLGAELFAEPDVVQLFSPFTVRCRPSS